MKVKSIEISDRNENYYGDKNVEIAVSMQESIIVLTGISNRVQNLALAGSNTVKISINGKEEFSAYCYNNTSKSESLKFEALGHITF